MPDPPDPRSILLWHLADRRSHLAVHRSGEHKDAVAADSPERVCRMEGWKGLARMRDCNDHGALKRHRKGAKAEASHRRRSSIVAQHTNDLSHTKGRRSTSLSASRIRVSHFVAIIVVIIVTVTVIVIVIINMVLVNDIINIIQLASTRIIIKPTHLVGRHRNDTKRREQTLQIRGELLSDPQ